jgi:hypothetical protein
MIKDFLMSGVMPKAGQLLPWKEQIANTVKSIYKNTSKPIMICLSGGIDSEIVAREFLESNVPFTAVIFKHDAGTNDHDIQFALTFCKENNIEFKIIEFNFDNFLNVKIDSYIQSGYTGVGIFRYLQLLMLEEIEKLGGYAVMGAGEYLFYTKDDQVTWAYSSDYITPYQWCDNNNTDHCPFFFFHNPEIMASYLNLDLIKFLTSDSAYFSNWMTEGKSLEKQLIYHALWKGMPRRMKFNGFEKVNAARWQKNAMLNKTFPAVKKHYMPLTLLKTQLGI